MRQRDWVLLPSSLPHWPMTSHWMATTNLVPCPAGAWAGVQFPQVPLTWPDFLLPLWICPELGIRLISKSGLSVLASPRGYPLGSCLDVQVLIWHWWAPFGPKHVSLTPRPSSGVLSGCTGVDLALMSPLWAQACEPHLEAILWGLVWMCRCWFGIVEPPSPAGSALLSSGCCLAPSPFLPDKPG